jgi:hypothetical protein
MSVALSERLRNTGTRFRIFAQPRFLEAFREPEAIFVSVPPDRIRPGPSDDQLYVVDALGKQPYAKTARPPYAGASNTAVVSGPDGHFDHLDPDSREFSCATMFATVRYNLDIWEDFVGHRLDWHFAADLPRLELIPLIEWSNAQSGYGYLEFGYTKTPNGGLDFGKPHCQNFDVLAHEFGHSLIFSVVGAPKNPSDLAVDYAAMHESSGDLVAMIGSLHFESVVTRLLDSTQGNLFSFNELSRVGELSANRQVRNVFNYLRMSDVNDEPHLRSLPLTGGIFDVLVEVFQAELIARGLIDADLAGRSTHTLAGTQNETAIQAEFARVYAGNAAGFKQALLEARDYLGRLLAKTWSTLSPDFLTFHEVLRTMLRADRELTGGAREQTIRDCFAWREIRAPADSRLFAAHRLDACVPDAPGAPAGAANGPEAELEPAAARKRRAKAPRSPKGRAR